MPTAHFRKQKKKEEKKRGRGNKKEATRIRTKEKGTKPLFLDASYFYFCSPFQTLLKANKQQCWLVRGRHVGCAKWEYVWMLNEIIGYRAHVS